MDTDQIAFADADGGIVVEAYALMLCDVAPMLMADVQHLAIHGPKRLR